MRSSDPCPVIRLALTALALAAGSASAQTVLIDLSTTDAPAIPAGDGKYWNSLGSGAADVPATALIDSANASTGVSLAIDIANVQAGGTSGAGFGGTGINGPAGADPFDEAAVVADGVFCNNTSNGTAVFIFSGLVPDTVYDVSAIGGRSSNGVDGQIIILDSNSPLGSSPLSGETNYTLLNDGTVLDFSTLSNASGEIFFEFRNSVLGNQGGINATFNALSITPSDSPLSPPKVTSITKSGSTVTVEFEGADGATYDLNKSTDLDFSTLDSKDSVTLSGTTTGTLQDTNATESSAFYRVEAQ